MRSLAVKLALAFVFVGLTCIGILYLMGVQTQREFGQFMAHRYRSDLSSALVQYYQEHDGWSGMDRLPGTRRPSPESGDGRAIYFGEPVTVVDGDRHVVYSRTHAGGEQLSADQIEEAAALIVDGQTIGWVVFDEPVVRQPARDSPEADFIQRIRQAVVLAVAAALAVAVVSGVLLARTLTRPVRDLTAATRALTRGDLGQQVEIHTNDELGQLGKAFNHMSAQLARSVQLRRQMTADIAHDLRTPLSVILGYTEALADGKLAGTPQTYAVLHDEAQHLRRLIDDLRVLSLADSGELALHRTPISPAELLARAALAQQVEAEQKHIRLVVDAGDELPLVEADPERLAQVLGNLLGNSLRHTPAGGEIRLVAMLDDGFVAMQVRDTGAGIAVEDLPNIFERFYRADRARAQNGESGLGLAIAKSLVEMHDGTISAASEPGQGSVFTVRLPAAQAS